MFHRESSSQLLYLTYNLFVCKSISTRRLQAKEKNVAFLDTNIVYLVFHKRPSLACRKLAKMVGHCFTFCYLSLLPPPPSSVRHSVVDVYVLPFIVPFYTQIFSDWLYNRTTLTSKFCLSRPYYYYSTKPQKVIALPKHKSKWSKIADFCEKKISVRK